jgi:hypothetical protein
VIQLVIGVVLIAAAGFFLLGGCLVVSERGLRGIDVVLFLIAGSIGIAGLVMVIRGSASHRRDDWDDATW